MTRIRTVLAQGPGTITGITIRKLLDDPSCIVLILIIVSIEVCLSLSGPPEPCKHTYILPLHYRPSEGKSGGERSSESKRVWVRGSEGGREGERSGEWGQGSVREREQDNELAWEEGQVKGLAVKVTIPRERE